MQIDPNQNDDTLDRVLSSLRNAALPENMQARIAQRLRHASPAAPAPSRLRSVLIGLIGLTPTAAWTRGALTGAACAAAFLLFALPFLRRSSAPIPPQTLPSIATQSTAPTATTVNLPIERKATSLPQATPCAKPTITPLPTTQTASSTYKELRADVPLKAITPSHPAPPLPLTPQERQLVRLVRVASPAALASLNPELEAKRDAEEAANFQKFFAPPPRPVDSLTSPEAPRTSIPMLNE